MDTTHNQVKSITVCSNETRNLSSNGNVTNIKFQSETQQSRWRNFSLRSFAFFFSALLIIFGMSGTEAKAQSGHDDNLSVNLDNLITLGDLDKITVNLPQLWDAENPKICLIIDPDNDPLTDDSFPLVIDLDGLLGAPDAEGVISGIIDDAAELLDEDALEGVGGLLDSLGLGGILGFLGLDGLASIDELDSELADAVVESISIILDDPLDGVLTYVYETILMEDTLVATGEDSNYQPDVTVGKVSTMARHVGNDKYTSGNRQSVKNKVKKKRNAYVYFGIGNDGNTDDTFSAHGAGSNRYSKSRYYDLTNRRNITSQLRAGTAEFEVAAESAVNVQLKERLKKKWKRRLKARKKKKIRVNREVLVRSTTENEKFDAALARFTYKR